MNKRQLKKKLKKMQNLAANSKKGNAKKNAPKPAITKTAEVSMPVVMIQVKDAAWQKIISLEKTVDIRKAMPKGASFPLKAIVYVSRKGVAGEVIIDNITPFDVESASSYASLAAMSVEEINDYSKGKELYAWKISNGRVKKYDAFKPVTDYGMDKAPTTWKYVK